MKNDNLILERIGSVSILKDLNALNVRVGKLKDSPWTKGSTHYCSNDLGKFISTINTTTKYSRLPDIIRFDYEELQASGMPLDDVTELIKISYRLAALRLNEKPKECYIDAANRKVVNYKRLNKISDVVEVIGLGKPVIIGADVFDDFDFLGPDNTEMHLPGEGANPDGSHAMCIVGYSIPNFHFIVKNSYGNSWGDQGYCTMPFEYFNKYVYESWCFDIQLPYTMNRVIWS